MTRKRGGEKAYSSRMIPAESLHSSHCISAFVVHHRNAESGSSPTILLQVSIPLNGNHRSTKLISYPSMQDHSKSRVRDNQRRSRARRTEYVRELESKWQSCREAGAEASREIQAAARRVAEENRKLRLLLRERGVSDVETDAYLKASSQTQSQPTAELGNLLSSWKTCGDLSLGLGPEEASPLVTNALQTEGVQATEQTTHAGESPNVLNHQAMPIAGACSSSGSREIGHENLATDDPRPVSPVLPDRPGSLPPDPPPATQSLSSCIAAATIISDLALDLDPGDVRADLGCKPYEADCVVDSKVLFSVMDRRTSRGMLS